ncbi:MAG: hypothetical protein ABEH56_00540 [Salinirussus sp.]
MDETTTSVRLPTELTASVERVAERAEGRTDREALGRTATRLALVGRGAAKADETPRILGPLGLLPRPFARVSFGDDRTETVPIGLDESSVAAFERLFGTGTEPALRRAIELGVVTVRAEAPAVEGPLGTPRPFARVEPPETVAGDREQAALDRLQLFMRGREVVRATADRRTAGPK